MKPSELTQRIEELCEDNFHTPLDISRYAFLLQAHYANELEDADDEKVVELVWRIHGQLTQLMDQYTASGAEINKFMETGTPGPSPELTQRMLRMIKTQRSLMNFSIGLKKER